MAALLRLDNLSKFYTGKQSVVVGLDKINLTFRRGEFVAVTGESGSGKSTLSHVLGGILPYESGEMYFGGSPTSHFDGVDWERYRRDQISFISQNYGILPGASVLSNVVSALRLTGMEKEQARLAAKEILEQVELWELRRSRAAKLSSGQKQRLAIARALAKPAPILIADEPTGNLDPENSRKVMELLAKAARERLVILVTHEFSEAEEFATRHIVLQDGRVMMDARLRDAREPEAMPRRSQDKKKGMSLYVARLQQRSRPVWAGMMVSFFAVTAFAVFAFLGTFIVALDDSNTRIYDDSAFFNGNPKRIVVSTANGEPMTQEDYDRLLAMPYVSGLERNGYVSDVQYAYREGRDYTYRYVQLQWGLDGKPQGDGHDQDLDGDGTNAYVTVSEKAPFLQTVPLLPQGEEFLTAGRMPENIFEVVAKAEASQLGRYTVAYLTYPDRWGNSQVLRLEVDIVGVTDRGSGLYFHDDVGRVCQQAARMNSRDGIYIFLPNSDLDNETFLSNATVLNHFLVSGAYTQPDGSVVPDFRNLNVADPEAEGAYVQLRLPMDMENPELTPRAKQANTQQCAYVMEVSPENFHLLTWNSASEQVSLTISDYAYTDRVLKAAQDMGYIALSVYRLGATEQIPERVLERSQTLKICAMALIVVVLLQIILLRAMFANQTGDYKTLSNIGLTCADALGSICWQLAALALAGQVLAGLGVWLCVLRGVKRIINVLVYLPIGYLALLLGLHVLASFIGTVWVLLSLKKQVYPLAGRDGDLDRIEEGEVQVL